jgi:hypothetical protein
MPLILRAGTAKRTAGWSLLPLFLISVVSDTGCARHTSDEEMQNLLSEHRPEFEQLLQMIQADVEVVSITPTSLLMRNKLLLRYEGDTKQIEQVIPAARWSKYQELFRRAHVQGGVFKEPDGAIDFEMDRPSFRNGDSRKGISYELAAPVPLLKSLNGLGFDDLSKVSPRNRTAYRQVSKDWYLYLYFNS